MPQPDLGPFVGTWKIAEMDLWSEDVINEFVPAEITFERSGGGHIQFIVVQGDLDCTVGERRGLSAVEWSRVGDDDGHDVSGRGWCVLHNGDSLEGMIYFHRGDHSAFNAVRR